MTDSRPGSSHTLYALVVESAVSGSVPGERRKPPARYGIQNRETMIGRAPGCPVRLDDMFVSRQHARLVLRDDELYLEDLDSTNQTRVNGAPVPTRVRIHPGDILLFGGARCRIEPFGAEGAAAAPEPPGASLETPAIPHPGGGAGAPSAGPAHALESEDRGARLPPDASPSGLFVAGPLPGEPGRTRLRVVLTVLVAAVVMAIAFVLIR